MESVRRSRAVAEVDEREMAKEEKKEGPVPQSPSSEKSLGASSKKNLKPSILDRVKRYESLDEKAQKEASVLRRSKPGETSPRP